MAKNTHQSFVIRAFIYTGLPSVVEVTGTDDSIDAGDEAKLTCSVQGGKPPANDFSWFLDGRRVEGEDMETIEFEAKAGNNGQSIACRATNLLGSVDSKEAVLQVLCMYTAQLQVFQSFLVLKLFSSPHNRDESCHQR